MAALHIDFEWSRDVAGYAMRPAEVGERAAYHAPTHRALPKLPVLPGQWGLAYVPLGIRVMWSPDGEGGKPLHVLRQGGELKSYRPLEVFDSLYAFFAKVRSPDDVLRFIERFGPLTRDGLDPEKGELVQGVLEHADAMRDLLHFSTKESAGRAAIVNQANPFAEMEVALEFDAGTEALKLRLCPSSLLDAVWLQAAQQLSSGATLRQCGHCGLWFEVGPGTGRRLDAKFCCDQHRVSFNSLKRTNSEASHA